MTLITKSGWESMGTWLLATSVLLARIRFATKCCNSGCTVRSLVATIYELGFDSGYAIELLCKQARSQGKVSCPTNFFSCSDKSPAKHSTPSGSIQIRPSATSMCEKTSVTGNFSCWLCDVSSSRTRTGSGVSRISPRFRALNDAGVSSMSGVILLRSDCSRFLSASLSAVFERRIGT
jgi:hypothetical protein